MFSSCMIYFLISFKVHSDETCDGLMLGKNKLNCLIWADDCVVFAFSKIGLQNDKTVEFFTSHGLSVNNKKTQCLIFNKCGLMPKFFPNVIFFINSHPLTKPIWELLLLRSCVSKQAGHGLRLAMWSMKSRECPSRRSCSWWTAWSLP